MNSREFAIWLDESGLLPLRWGDQAFIARQLGVTRGEVHRRIGLLRGQGLFGRDRFTPEGQAWLEARRQLER